MKKVVCTIILSCFCLTLFTGCVFRQGNFSVISNKLVRTADFELDKADRAKGIEGSDMQVVLLFIPLSGPPTLMGALDDAFEKGGGDVMTDAVIKTYFIWIPLIYAQSGWVVKGDVVKTRKK
jgi:hypothetical protein